MSSHRTLGGDQKEEIAGSDIMPHRVDKLHTTFGCSDAAKVVENNEIAPKTKERIDLFEISLIAASFS